MNLTADRDTGEIMYFDASVIQMAYLITRYAGIKQEERSRQNWTIFRDAITTQLLLNWSEKIVYKFACLRRMFGPKMTSLLSTVKQALTIKYFAFFQFSCFGFDSAVFDSLSSTLEICRNCYALGGIRCPSDGNMLGLSPVLPGRFSSTQLGLSQSGFFNTSTSQGNTVRGRLTMGTVTVLLYVLVGRPEYQFCEELPLKFKVYNM